MSYSQSSNGGPAPNWYIPQLQSQPATQDSEFDTPPSENVPVYQATSNTEYTGNARPDGQSDWEGGAANSGQNLNVYPPQTYSAQTNSAPFQVHRDRQYVAPQRRYHSDNAGVFHARYSNQLQHSGYSNNSSLSPYLGQLEMPTSIHGSLSPNAQLNFSNPWNSHASPSNTFNGLQPSQNWSHNSANLTSFAGSPNTLDRRSSQMGGFQTGGTQMTAAATERHRLDAIRGWMLSRPDANIFDPTQIQMLASSLAISVLQVQQLYQILMRNLSQSAEAVQSTGRLGISRTPSYSSFTPAPSSMHSSTEVPQHFIAALEWLRQRGPRCELATRSKALKRRGEKIYQCTRCGLGFARKDEWIRHEHAGIYPQEAWLCNIEPTVLVDGVPTCASCGIQNPDTHPSHRPHASCHNRSTFDRRIFFRKYQFRKHFQNCHKRIPVHEYIAASHIQINTVFPLNCGFCSEERFQSWKARVNHIADHYKNDGDKDMRYWEKPADFIPDSDSDSDQEFDQEDEDDDDDENDDDGTGGDNGQDFDHGLNYAYNNDEQYPGSSNGHTGTSGYDYSGSYTVSNGNSNFPSNGGAGGQQYSLALRTSPLETECNTHCSIDVDVGTFVQPNNCAIKHTSTAPSVLQEIHQLPQTTSQEPEGTKAETQINATSCGPFSNNSYALAAGVNRSPRTSSHLISAVKRIKGTFSRKYQDFRNPKIVVVRPHQTPSILVGNILSTSFNPTKSNETVSTLVESHYGLPSASYDSSSSIVLRRTGLETRLLDEQIPWGNGRFLPNAAFECILTHDAIQKELDAMKITPSSILTDKIYKKARKIFGILVCIGKGTSMLSFMEHGMTDEELPFEIPQEASLQHIWMSTREPFQGFSLRELDGFSRVQWSFLAPVFFSDKETVNHYDFDSRSVLPFVNDAEFEARSGGFGEVWSVDIHPSHHNLLGSKGNMRFAIKRLHSRDKADFDREASMLKTLTRKKHEHLIQLLCTYKFRGQYHLMFPFAEANLRQFWEKTDPQVFQETFRWVMDQLCGIASALNAIHNYRLLPIDRLSQSGDLRVSVPGAEYYYGRHGDIKPENILWFKGEPGTHGILVITDLGLGGFHTQHSRSNVAARNLGGSVTYAPPELALNTPVSRAFDIWSLGCVYLEFVVWLLQGRTGLEMFGTDRSNLAWDGVEDDSFYQILPDSQTEKLTADIRPAVKDWILILDNDPKRTTVIHNLLTLIKTRMLVIQPRGRIESVLLSGKLGEVFGTDQEGGVDLR